MIKTVEITIDTETGDLTVAEIPGQEAITPGGGGAGMAVAAPAEGAEPAAQTFKSLDEALAAAAAILTEERAEGMDAERAAMEQAFAASAKEGA